jgi:outer membrane protein assembly factor BamB
MIEPDVQVYLERISPVDGKTIWSVPFDRELRPYRCEAYTNRIVAFFYSKGGFAAQSTQVFFLNDKTGEAVKPFDTHQFIWPKQDPLIARSSHGSQGSVEEERGELSLPNGWRSHGVAGLSWRNAGENNICFFRATKLEWTLTLPEGAYNLAHWNNILIYRRYTEGTKKIIDTLYAQPAGRDSTSWSFALPSDIPDRSMSGGDVITDRTHRGFTHAVGKDHIYAFGAGNLFTLDPQTGQLLRRHTLSEDPVIKTNSVSIESAEMVESGGQLYFFTRNELVRFDLDSNSTAAVLRRNLYDGPLPLIYNGTAYCFTQRP